MEAQRCPVIVARVATLLSAVLRGTSPKSLVVTHLSLKCHSIQVSQWSLPSDKPQCSVSMTCNGMLA